MNIQHNINDTSDDNLRERKEIWTDKIRQYLFCIHDDDRYDTMYKFYQTKNLNHDDHDDDHDHDDNKKRKHRKYFQWITINDNDTIPFFSSERDSWISFAIYHKRFNKRKNIAAINCNYVFINTLKRTENDHNIMYTSLISKTKQTILEKCRKLKIPEPQIIYSGDGIQLIWLWNDYMTKKEYLNDFFGYNFNKEWEEMQKKLLKIFKDLGADPRRSSATAMFRIPGSINTIRRLKGNDRIVRVIHQGEVINSYTDMQYALGLITYQPQTPKFNLWEKFKAQNNTTAWLAFQWEQEILKIHKTSDNWVCIFRQKNQQKKVDWVMAKNLREYLMQLYYSPNFSKENIYVSQLEFARKKRTIDKVCSIGANFLDLDYKELQKVCPEIRENPSPDEWVKLVNEHIGKINGIFPDAIVFTGGGVHLKWIYKSHTSVHNLDKWKILQKMLALLFRKIGADFAAIDASRILRLPGSYNQKSEEHISDHNVKLVAFSQELRFNFEDLVNNWAQANLFFEDEEIVSEFEELRDKLQGENKKKEYKQEQNDETEAIEANAEAIFEHLIIHEKTCNSKMNERDLDNLYRNLFRIHPKCNSTWVQLMFPDGCKFFIRNYELEEYLQKYIHPNSEVRISAAEYYEPKLNLESITCNFVIINNCPGENVEEKIDNILKHCEEYRDVGFPIPNQIIRVDDTYILEWVYTNSLPDYAISRWLVTQEFICRHFQDWGAVINDTFLSPHFHLPLPGFQYQTQHAELVFSCDEISYSFDELATKVLPFYQEEVEKYRQEKLEKKLRKIQLAVPSSESSKHEKRGVNKKRKNFAVIARRRFNDIKKLLKMRKNNLGEVPSGSRELCVFYATISAIQAGIVPQTKEGIEKLLRSLIDFCGLNFKSECNTKTFGTLIRKFLAGDHIIYKLKTSTIIMALGITKTEQAKLTTLKIKPTNSVKIEKKKREPRALWLAKHSTEREKPWLALDISRATWFRRKKRKNIDIDQKQNAM